MNWIKMIAFLIFITYFYHLFGMGILTLFKIKSTSTAKNLLTGFLGLTCIQWIIGFPAQVLHLSWNTYFMILLAVYTLLFLFLLKCFGIKKSSKSVILNSINKFIKQYWFIIFLTLSFAYWSMSSQLPYLLLNYDDHYYIGAIVQQIGSDSLSTVNYFNGTPMDMELSRLINSFEINYGFWSSLFQMNPAFFARAAMVIHNYFMIFMSIFAFIESFKIIKSEYIQYAFISFAILLLPAIFLSDHLAINLYDEWQMNTAIWYGGSIVRLISLPVCFMFIRETIDDFNWKKLFYALLPFPAFLSFSSIFVPIAIISIGMGFLYVLWTWYEKHRNQKNLFVIIIILLLVVFGLKMGPKVLEIIKPSLTTFYENSSSVWSNVRAYSNRNILFVLLSACLVLFTKKWQKESFYKVAVIVCAVCILFYGDFFNKFLITICIGMDFVVYRFVTSLQILLFILCNIIFVWLISTYMSKKIFALAAVSFTGLVHVTMYYNFKDCSSLKNVGLGSGVSIYGYSPERLLKNPYMMPNFYVDFQKYFETLSRERHRIISPQIIPYEDGTHFIGASLAMIANNVESCMSDNNVRCDNIDYGTISSFDAFARGAMQYKEVEPLLKKHNIEYVIVADTQLKDELLKEGLQVAAQSTSIRDDHIYLMKLQ